MSQNILDCTFFDTEACCGDPSKTSNKQTTKQPSTTASASDIFCGAESAECETAKARSIEKPVERRPSGSFLGPPLFISKESVTTEYSDEPVKEETKNKRKWIVLAFTACLVLAGVLIGGAFLGRAVFEKDAEEPESAIAEANADPVEDPAPTTTAPPSESELNTKILVGAYYYPWHAESFHTGSDYLRAQLDPPQQPTLGEYDGTQPEVIQQHLDWSRQANIGLWITSWRGPASVTDNTTRSSILDTADLGELRIAVHYETVGRVQDKDLGNVSPDLEYICENYFGHPNYYRVDGRPVIFVNVSRKLERLGLLENAVLAMRSTASKCGENLYVVGDHIFQDAPDELTSALDTDMISSFVYFDAITNFDVYGSMGVSVYPTEDSVDEYYSDQLDWKSLAAQEGCKYVPAVTPGFNDRGKRPQVKRSPLARRLLFDQGPGTLFSYSLDKARRLVDPEIDNLIVVNSFNQWNEDTQIEPCTGGEPTQLPVELTGGLQYTSYGELYLDILYNKTIDPIEVFSEEVMEDLVAVSNMDQSVMDNLFSN